MRTELIRDINHPDRYVTFDFWSSGQSYDDFMSAHESEYQSIDQRMSALTRSERKLGGFEIPPDRNSRLTLLVRKLTEVIPSALVSGIDLQGGLVGLYSLAA